MTSLGHALRLDATPYMERNLELAPILAVFGFWLAPRSRRCRVHELTFSATVAKCT